MNRVATLFIVTALQLVACSSTSNAPSTTAATSKVSVAKATAGAMSVEMLTDSQLSTGMVPVDLKVATADGQLVTDATVSFVPLMSMADGMQHSAPVVGEPTVGADGLYHFSVVFQMASTDVDTWTATVQITRPGEASEEATLPAFAVPDSGRAKVFMFSDPTSSATTRYITSLNFVNAPKIGLNPVALTVHYRQDMMTFPPVDDATIVLDPQMPSMGHGSPGSINPTPTSLGVYTGELSFSMPGAWETTVTLSRSGVVVGAPVFATNF